MLLYVLILTLELAEIPFNHIFQNPLHGAYARICPHLDIGIVIFLVQNIWICCKIGARNDDQKEMVYLGQ